MKTVQEIYKEAAHQDASETKLQKKDFQRFKFFIKSVKEQYQKTNKRVKILDIGPKNAGFYMLLKKEKFPVEYTALDVSKERCKRLGKHGIKPICANAEHMKQAKTSSFDVVILGETIEHLFNVGLVLAEIRRVLKKGGYFVGSTPTGHLEYRIASTVLRWFTFKFNYHKDYYDRKHSNPLQHIQLYLRIHLKTFFNFFDLKIIHWEPIAENRLIRWLAKKNINFGQKLVWKAVNEKQK